MSALLKKELRTIDEKEEGSPFSINTKRTLPILRESISPINLAQLKQPSLVKEGNYLLMEEKFSLHLIFLSLKVFLNMFFFIKQFDFI